MSGVIQVLALASSLTPAELLDSASACASASPLFQAGGVLALPCGSACSECLALLHCCEHTVPSDRVAKFTRGLSLAPR